MGYGEAPWDFRGRALYQLSLVRVEEARKYVPPELPLVNFFGWTLGGFYLARYSASPVGAFDECVALAGLAWNFPTSCAWAARVYVNDREARDHGISSVGLPSRLANFRALPMPALRGGGGGGSDGSSEVSKQQGKGKGKGKGSSWWDLPFHRSGGSGVGRGGGSVGAGSAAASGGSGSGSGSSTAAVELYNVEPASAAPATIASSSGGSGGGGGFWGLLPWRRRRAQQQQQRPARGLASPVCRIEMPQVAPAWAPQIQMFLPSFSGATPDFPGLLKYSLKLTANIRPLPPARISFPQHRAEGDQGSPEVLDAVLGGRPLVCLAFDNMHMEVQPPEPWHPKTAAAPHGTALRPAAA